ncbi:MAG: MvaI/BcnI family restriction endonuclease [Opitutaceae bacterium]|nr:MvaI/BcnI family restriction endonuclease [Opitutaceae bacterium]
MTTLLGYASDQTRKAGKTFLSGEVFAKVLTKNDDSGRHGVLIPSDAYSFFPDFPIPDPTQNATEEFLAFDAIKGTEATLAYKYYERYPERRITRLHGSLSDLTSEPRLLVFLKAKHSDGSTAYYFDCANSAQGGRFAELFGLVFGDEVSAASGRFVVRPVDSEAFSADPPLEELLAKFDQIKELGWVDALRIGDTGIGYTFESLLGIEENNDQRADFKGIEIKCKGSKDGGHADSTKINLFQAGPTWAVNATAKERIRILGRPAVDGLYACYSQLTTTPNNLGLLLDVIDQQSKIDLRKEQSALGYWSFAQLEGRLLEKHSRTAFVHAKTRATKSKTQFSYEELVYCDRPSIARFVELVAHRNIVFEFTLSEKPNGSIRNHGYPWRLIRSEFLDQLFAFQIKLR